MNLALAWLKEKGLDKCAAFYQSFEKNRLPQARCAYVRRCPMA